MKKFIRKESLYISISQSLIDNSNKFLNIKKISILNIFRAFFQDITFVGWGRKKSGTWAVRLAKLTKNNFLLLEDGFIRSLGLGVDRNQSFSLIQDDIGIYYDATTPSSLENILTNYDFKNDFELIEIAKKAQLKIIEYKISKYNSSIINNLDYLDNDLDKVLIIAQTAGDSSLKYGLGELFTTKEMIDDAIKDNPLSEVYIKLHPDVLKGTKKSDIRLEEIPGKCKVLTANINPIHLLEYFDKIYTKTSGMGMEALLLNKKVYCYGLPFYAGWGLTYDKQVCSRRNRELSIDELFAGSYILYTTYYSLELEKEIDILSLLEYIKTSFELDSLS